MSSENLLLLSGATSITAYFFYHFLSKKTEAEEHYKTLKNTKIWSIEEIKLETLKNNANPAYPSTLNYEEFSRFNNVLIQGELWCEEEDRIQGKVLKYDRSGSNEGFGRSKKKKILFFIFFLWFS